MQISNSIKKLEYNFYRLKIILNSLKTLYTLPPHKVDAFFNSYDMFDHNWNDKESMIKNFGANYYNEIKQKIIDYYGVLNHLCSVGQIEKMYIPPAMDLAKNITENQNLFEKKMAQDLGLKKKHKALDIGCGRGRIASHVASITGAKVTGINLEPDQLQAANKFSFAYGLSKQCHFKQWDLNETPYPFADNYFDAIYHVQVFTYAKDLNRVFKDIYRMLKPGGKFACLDWILLNQYDPKNPHHVDLLKRTKSLVSAIGTPSIEEYIAAMKQAGLKVLKNENASIDGLQAPLIENADKFFNQVTTIANLLVKTKLLPPHFKTLFERFIKDGPCFVEADRLRLVTSSHYFVAEKN